VAQWLFNLDGVVDIHAENDSAFLEACRNGHLTTAQWLYSLGDIDIHFRNDLPFQAACGHGHLSIAQWLCNLGGIDIHRQDDSAFRYACLNNYLVVAQWLYSLEGEISITTLQSCLKSVSNYQVRSWLQSITTV
jgi:hypothetical protein